MRLRKTRHILGLVGLVLLLGGCAQLTSSNESDGLKWNEIEKIIPVTRENGSGTRSSFAEALELNMEGVDDRDAITEAAQTETSGEEMIRAVEKEPGAIGYVTYSTDLTSENGAKEIAVNGEKAENETIEKGSYPLTRSLYLAYSGNESELERDFVNYVTGKGQLTIEEFFVPVGGKEVFLSNQASGTLIIHGSTTLAPVIKELAEEYEKENTNAQIQVEASDSSQGITDVLTGKCNIAMVSRELYQYESEVLEAEVVAKDGIRVIVNKENPIDDISLDMLEKIYSGEISKWKNTQE